MTLCLHEMGKKKKATQNDADPEWNPKKSKVPKSDSTSNICIIHTTSCSSHHFTSINSDSLKRLSDIRDERQQQPIGSSLRMDDVCKLFSQYENSQVLPTQQLGYHTGCYKSFTRHVKRLKVEKSESAETLHENEAPSTRLSLPSGGTSDKILFNPDCIFCNLEGPKRHYSKSHEWRENISSFSFDGGQHVQEVAENRNDERLLLRIRGVNLFSVEARFHESCRKSYISVHKPDQQQKEHQESLQNAHSQAFESVCDKVLDEVINQLNIVKLCDLRDHYVKELDKTEFANPNYRADKLRQKLQKHPSIGEKISFTSFQKNESHGRFKSQLVFSRSIDVESAVKRSYELGAVDRTEEIAKSIRVSILDAYKKVDKMPWPPTAEYLKSHADIAPQYLKNFLKIVFTGKETYDEQKDNSRLNRFILSVGQDICRAATNGLWSLPKHILLCMTLRHMFRSKELITLLNRFGHCENYHFSLELETAIAKSVQLSSSILSPEISRNPTGKFVFHSEFDNFDDFVNDIFGPGIVNTAHGIMLQDLDTNQDSAPLPNNHLPKTKERSFRCTEQVLPEVYVTQRKSPTLITTKRFYQGSSTAYDAAVLRNVLWTVLRSYSSCVPAWGGFISSTGMAPKQLTTIGYYPVIYKPITDYSTVAECLSQSEEATKEVGQDYVITTFDLGVCMKAYPLIFNNPLRYKNHIILIGTFHLMGAYFRMIGKKMESSGLEDIMREASLVKSGTVKGVMNGKNYARSIGCHKVVTESLERLLLDMYIKGEAISSFFDNLPSTSREKLDKLVESPSQSILEEVLNDAVILQYLQSYLSFKEKARNGNKGKTAQYWMSYVDQVWLCLRLYEAVKRNDFLLYAHCICLMADLFFSYGGQNYARYLTMFSIILANIDESHPGAVEMLKQGAFSVARSFIPGNRGDVDKTMEETFMKEAKSHGGASGAGITGIQRNYDAYQRWVRTRHERSKYLSATYALAGLSQDHHKMHKDLRKSNVKKSHTMIDKTIDAINSFLNPFTIDETKLFCLSSGVPVPSDVEADLLQAEVRGAEAKNDLIVERGAIFHVPTH